MDSEIGNGNTEIKIEAAKDAAIAAVDRALASAATEVAVLAFEGECDNPISQVLDFTTDVNRLTRFIRSLQAGGGTPMAEAVLVANRFMQDNGTAGTHSQMIVLLADGDNQCGDVAQAMDQLRAAGIVFRHETVGFGIAPTSDAARDLRHVANTSGGQYHHAATATQLADVFMEFVDTFTVIDMLGMFGNNPPANTPGGNVPGGQASPASSPASAAPSTQAGTPQGGDKGNVTSMIGTFRMAKADDDTAGALALDADQGTAWAWAAGYATEAEAKRAALAQCGANCRIVLSFRDGCAAYVADQARGSSVRSWASEHDTQFEATKAALDGCAQRGGTDCLVRVWACGAGFGGGAPGRGPDASTITSQDVTPDTDGPDQPFGALAIDSGQGTEWAWAFGAAVQAEAERVALEQCGDGCRAVGTWRDGCAAYAADQAPGSGVSSWVSGHRTEFEVRQAALASCAQRGGTDCLVRVWACSGGFGGGAPGRGPEAAPIDATVSIETPFGALAIEPEEGTSWGWSSGYPTQAEAESIALEQCGDGCRVVFTFHDECAAFAEDQTTDSTAMGWASGRDTRDVAEQIALRKCVEAGGTNCVVQAGDCM